MGHGFGGSAAVFAAAGMPAKPAAVAAISRRHQSPGRAAGRDAAGPGFDLDRAGNPKTLNSNALALSRAWDTASLRIVSKAHPGGLIEGRRLTKAVGLPGPHRRTQRAVRALLTGYLLATLADDKTYRDFADPEAHLPKTDPVDPEAPPVTPEEKIVALLK